MKTEVYTCDCCKKSKSYDDLAHLTIQSNGLKLVKTTPYQISISKDICKDCLERKGIVVHPSGELAKDKIADEKNQKVLEDKLIGILEDLGVAFCE